MHQNREFFFACLAIRARNQRCILVETHGIVNGPVIFCSVDERSCSCGNNTCLIDVREKTPREVYTKRLPFRSTSVKDVFGCQTQIETFAANYFRIVVVPRNQHKNQSKQLTNSPVELINAGRKTTLAQLLPLVNNTG